MLTLQTTIEDLNHLGLLTVRAMNVCHRGGIKTLGDLKAVDMSDIQKIYACGRRTLMELETIKRDLELDHLEESQSKQDEAIGKSETESLKETDLDSKGEFNWCFSSPLILIDFRKKIDNRFAKLSVRAKNTFPHLVEIFAVLRIICNDVVLDYASVKQCGKKTQLEIESYLNDVRYYIEQLKKEGNLICSISSESRMDDKWKLLVELTNTYPFLSLKDCEYIVDLVPDNTELIPYLYIAEKFIKHSDAPKISYYRDFYGFNDSATRYSLTEIGERNNISRERVRQIINSELPLPGNLKEQVKQYLAPLINNVISFDSTIWSRIQKENCLQGSINETIFLVCAVSGTHSIIQLDDDKKYLVRKSIIENVKIKDVLNNLCRVIELRHSFIKRLDILQYIKEEGKTYHGEIEDLCAMYADFIRYKYNLEVESERYIIILPNVIDISFALENILDGKGVPMSIDELFSSFNQLYPMKKFDTPVKLKTYLLRNPNIQSKGNTGVYLLKSWTKYYTGTLLSYLEHILHTFNEPVSLDDLYSFAKDEYPSTTKKSVYSLITGVGKSKFVVYEGNFISLQGFQLTDRKLYKKKTVKRETFDEKFERFKEFVNIRKRLPLQSDDESEASLARWMYNVLNLNTGATSDRIELLESFIQENDSLPHNWIEWKFKQMCDQVKVIVSRTFELPKVDENKQEYYWFKNNILVYRNYVDRRKAYFEDLILFLRDYGFYF